MKLGGWKTNVRDTTNPKGAQHAVDVSAQPNTNAVHHIRPTGYQGKHRQSGS